MPSQEDQGVLPQSLYSALMGLLCSSGATLLKDLIIDIFHGAQF